MHPSTTHGQHSKDNEKNLDPENWSTELKLILRIKTKKMNLGQLPFDSFKFNKQEIITLKILHYIPNATW